MQWKFGRRREETAEGTRKELPVHDWPVTGTVERIEHPLDVGTVRRHDGRALWGNYRSIIDFQINYKSSASTMHT
jgi:hypothetical protein